MLLFHVFLNRLRIFFNLGQNAFGVVEDAVQWSHLLMRVVGLDGIQI